MPRPVLKTTHYKNLEKQLKTIHKSLNKVLKSIDESFKIIKTLNKK